jgi:hypothetical protein
MSVILDRLMAALKATGAKYIIVMPDGTTHSQGDLKLAEDKQRKRRKGIFPRGSISAYYMPYIEGLLPGQLVEIPYHVYPPETIISGVSSRAVDMWGKGSAMTCRNAEKGVVEVLRVS